MKKSLFKSLFEGAKSRQQRESEYLNQSASLNDLELRQREVARGLFQNT